MRRLSLSTSRTRTWTSWPGLTTSLACADALVGQFGDVDQAFEARLQLDERAEIGRARHLAGDDHVGGVAFLDLRPRIAAGLLEAEAHALGDGSIDEHDHLRRCRLP